MNAKAKQNYTIDVSLLNFSSFPSVSTKVAKCTNNNDIENIPPDYWRSKCGIVMQDGFLFNDTIAGNIALGSDNIDWERLSDAARIANIHGFIEDLPQGFKTKIGNEGLSLSGGQKQRILIARAVYKEPEFIFFDEVRNLPVEDSNRSGWVH